MAGFAYDSTGQVNDFEYPIQPTLEELSAIMKHNAKLWNNLLWISRGATLELDRCFHHHINFNSAGNVSPRMGHIGPAIMISDNQSQS
jgi:hypothetical protein